MSRELVKVGDVEPLAFEWKDESTGEVATSAEVRVYIQEGTVRKFWNGASFTTTDATIAALSFASGVWTGEFTYPAAAAGKEVFIEAKPTAPASLVPFPCVDSRRVVNELPDGSEQQMDVRWDGEEG